MLFIILRGGYNRDWDSGIMRILILTLLVVTMLFCGACGASLIEVPLPDLDGVTEALGYSLAPTQLPEGYELEQYGVSGISESVVSSYPMPSAMLFYKKYEDYATHQFIIQYPPNHPPSISDDFLLETLGIEWQSPDDAVSEVEVNGETAYLVQGSWTAESLHHLINPDPEFLATYTPEWDYDFYFSLFFDFELSSGETVGVIIRDMANTGEWITAKEMVAIAESLQRVD
jgi:hypothetical protein